MKLGVWVLDACAREALEIARSKRRGSGATAFASRGHRSSRGSMTECRQSRLCLFGPSGAGKSTSAGLLEGAFRAAGQSVCRIKLAAPLYALQREFYRVAQSEIAEHDQDQLLMEDIAAHLRRINAACLVTDFERRLEWAAESALVINDDLRDAEVDYPRMRELGFRFVRIDCDEARRRARQRQRGDLTHGTRADSTNHLNRIVPDAIVDNGCDCIQELRARLQTAVGPLL